MNQSTPKRLPSLDGWRALSIIMVLGAHSRFTDGFPAGLTVPFQWMFDGDLGVRFFFVISGFLITWLIISEHDRFGSVDLKRFYARRALRILPVYFVFLLIVALLQWLGRFHQSSLAWIGNLTFTTNFIEGAFTTEHLWSLSTEEQFYLLWPGMFVLMGVASNNIRALRILAIPVLAAPICRVMGYTGHPALLYPLMRHFSFFAFCDSLAVGCATAVLLSRQPDLINKLMRAPGKAIKVGLVLLLVPYILMKMRWLRPITVPFGYTSQAFGFSLLLLASIFHPGRGAFRILNLSWVCRLGILSYSIYIWQGIFCSPHTTFGLEPVWWLSFPGWLIPALITGCVSYYAFEQPLLRLRSRLRKA